MYIFFNSEVQKSLLAILSGHVYISNIWFPDGALVKNHSPMQEMHIQSLCGGRFPGEGNGNPLQYSCLENSMDRGAWRSTEHGAAKSQTWLNTYTYIKHRLNDTFCKAPHNLKENILFQPYSERKLEPASLLETVHFKRIIFKNESF